MARMPSGRVLMAPGVPGDAVALQTGKDGLEVSGAQCEVRLLFDMHTRDVAGLDVEAAAVADLDPADGRAAHRAHRQARTRRWSCATATRVAMAAKVC